jgi:hypothetical protein
MSDALFQTMNVLQRLGRVRAFVVVIPCDNFLIQCFKLGDTNNYISRINLALDGEEQRAASDYLEQTYI